MLQLRTLGGLELRGPDGPVTGAASRRRPLALLAIIAAAGARGVTRERLVGILWSDSPEEQARHVLSQSLYALRRGLGADELVLDTGVLRLNPAVISSDIAQFNDAIDAGDRAGAIAAHQGSFLDGFYLSGAPVFERWVEEERARIAAKFHQALESEAEEAEASGNHARAAELWNRRVTSDPLATRPLIRLVRALDAAGERGAALRQLRIHRALLDQEGTAVASDVTALERTLQGPAPVSTAPVARAPIAPAVSAPAPVVEQTTMAPPRARRLAFLFGSIAVITAVLAFVVFGMRRTAPPVVAVGLVESHLRGDSSDLARALPDLVTTQLTQVHGLSIVSRARLLEVIGDEVKSLGPGTLARGARAAGANEIIEGAIYDDAGGMRLDLRRVELPDGKVHDAVSVTGNEPAALVERAVAALAASYGLAAPDAPLASVTSVVPVARRFYEEGLRAFYSDDHKTAARFFGASLAEDSTFAMAAYYFALSAPGGGADSLTARWERAMALAPRATDRERLLILSARAFALDDARGLALAETLAVRYPAELDGKQALGEQRHARGDFTGAVAAFLDVVRADSAGRSGAAARCRACDAMSSAIWVSLTADSLAAAERLSRELIRWKPERSGAYGLLGTALLRREDYRGATAAFRQQNELVPGAASLRWVAIEVARRQGEFTALDSIARDMIQDAESPGELHEGLLVRSDALRESGNAREALRVARRFSRSVDSLSGGRVTDPFVHLTEGLALLELGQADPRAAREAAALFDRMASMPGYPELRMARHRVWMWTHRATALALAGDTAELPALEQRIAEMARLSAYGRDWRMPYYVQGLLFEARQDWSRAADAYRQAIWSPTENHVAPRLARVLLRNGQHDEAIRVLQSWLRGPLDAANQYVRRSEAHQLLGDAFARAGQRDSAAVHHAWVQRAGKPVTTDR